MVAPGHLRPASPARLGLVVAAALLLGCSGGSASPAPPQAASPVGSPSSTTTTQAGPMGEPGVPAEASPGAAGGGSPVISPGAAGPPDIIVIMVDDLAFLPTDQVLERLPETRALWLEGGLRFTGMYDETPLCCPARATFLTGRHTLDHGVITNDAGPFDASTTLATTLDAAGYHTILAGKYLNGYEGTRTPPGWDQVMMRESEVIPSYSVDGELIRYDGEHFDDVLRRQAVEWLQQAPAEAALFALVAPRAPHRHPQQCQRGDRGCQYLPLVMAHDRGADACRDIPPFKPPTYDAADNGRAVPWVMPDWPDGWPLVETCESLLVVDRMVGELRAAQAARGRPAWWVFISDNGMAWGQKGSPGKHVPPATRLPFFVAGPGLAPGTTGALLSNIDLAPTLAELAGTEAPFPVGSSFVPLLEGRDVGGHEEILEIMPADPRGIYDGWAALRTPQNRYIRWDDGRRELYDLTQDPWEQTDLTARRPDLVASLDRRLDELVEGSARPAT